MRPNSAADSDPRPGLISPQLLASNPHRLEQSKASKVNFSLGLKITDRRAVQPVSQFARLHFEWKLRTCGDACV